MREGGREKEREGENERVPPESAGGRVIPVLALITTELSERVRVPGWRLVNYKPRLASSTLPDGG